MTFISKGFDYHIEREVGVIAENKGGWRKELNLVEWNGRLPVYDIRSWADGHTKMGKGISLNREDNTFSRVIFWRRTLMEGSGLWKQFRWS